MILILERYIKSDKLIEIESNVHVRKYILVLLLSGKDVYSTVKILKHFINLLLFDTSHKTVAIVLVNFRNFIIVFQVYFLKIRLIFFMI